MVRRFSLLESLPALWASTMAEPARKKDTEKVLPDADALPEAAFDNDLSFDEGFNDLQPMPVQAPITVRDVAINPQLDDAPLSEDADAPLDVQPDIDIEPPGPESLDDGSSAQSELASEEQAQQAGLEAVQLAQQNALLLAQVAELQHSQKQAQEEASRARDHARDLAQQLQKAPPPGEITRLRADLESTLSAHRQVEEDMLAARNEMELARAEIARLHAQQAELSTGPVRDSVSEPDQDNARMRSALEEAQGAIARVEHANEELSRKCRDLEARVAEARRSSELSKAAAEAKADLAAQFERELALARNELSQMGDQAADVVRRGHEIDDRKAELDRVTRALAEAQAQITDLRAAAQGAESSAREAKASAAEAIEKSAADKKRLLEAEREIKEARERLDTEAARSFRLSQRRIPSLQNDVAQEHAQNMELRRKIEKLEAEKRVLAEQQQAGAAKTEELERALAAAKARLSDTEIIRATDGRISTSQADEEVGRLAGRLKTAEEERRRLADTLAKLEAARREEIRGYEERLAVTSAQSAERLEQRLGFRKQARELGLKLSQAMKLATLLANARSAEEKKPVLDKIEEIAREAAAAEESRPAKAGPQASLTSAEPQPDTHPDDEQALERDLDAMPELPDFNEAE